MTINAILLANLVITVSGLLISLICLLMSIIFHKLGYEKDMLFITFFVILACYTFSETLNLLSTNVILSRITLFLSSLFSSMLITLIFIYFLQCAGKSWKKNKLFHYIVLLWVVYVAILVITQFTTFIYYFTPDNAYHRGPWYPILLIPPIVSMILNLIALYLYRSAISRRMRISFIVYYMAPLIGMIIQVYFYGIVVIVLGTTVSILFMFALRLVDEVELSYRQADKIASQHASILVLQMRPHFIYNTLTSIYYLCKKDSSKAQQVILDFSNYLKKNFTAITSENCIPFTEELGHIKAYLAVELVRYEDRLFVDYDIPVTMFNLPPLTLQPIVENAVKYGISPDGSPLNIHITTFESKDCFVVTIEDDGPGFIEPRDDSPHIALDNIRQRLKTYCDGTLNISQRKDGGTKVTVFLPKKR